MKELKILASFVLLAVIIQFASCLCFMTSPHPECPTGPVSAEIFASIGGFSLVVLVALSFVLSLGVMFADHEQTDGGKGPIPPGQSMETEA